MSEVHDQLGPFLDGELTAEEAAAFERHLAGCAQCQKDLVDFGAISALGTTPAIPAARPAARPSIARWLPFALAAALVIGVMGFVLTRPPQPVQVTLAQARPFEARLTWPTADAHRPFEPNRATTAQFENVSASTLADLEKSGDTRALASAWLLSGNLSQAKQVLAKLPAGADLESDSRRRRAGGR
ncbi:MAG: zf-HC2 domain-containing protein [Archangium sp.]